jgi:hypothetical protein
VQQQGIAVGSSLYNRFSADVAARSKPIFHHNRLAEADRHFFANYARDDVWKAAGAERNHKLDRAIGKRLRSSACDREQADD